jgi:hypothetical protein
MFCLDEPLGGSPRSIVLQTVQFSPGLPYTQTSFSGRIRAVHETCCKLKLYKETVGVELISFSGDFKPRPHISKDAVFCSAAFVACAIYLPSQMKTCAILCKPMRFIFVVCLLQTMVMSSVGIYLLSLHLLPLQAEVQPSHHLRLHGRSGLVRRGLREWFRNGVHQIRWVLGDLPPPEYANYDDNPPSGSLKARVQPLREFFQRLEAKRAAGQGLDRRRPLLDGQLDVQLDTPDSRPPWLQHRIRFTKVGDIVFSRLEERTRFVRCVYSMVSMLFFQFYFPSSHGPPLTTACT